MKHILEVAPIQIIAVALDSLGPLSSGGLLILVWSLFNSNKRNSLLELKHDPGLKRGISFLSSVGAKDELM